MQPNKKIVVLGGGSGTYTVLSGLKNYPIDLTAVISMCDSGGSTGRLRKELGMLPPGDIRRAILALSDLPFAHKTLEELFDFRFQKGASLRGHSVGNILLAALTQITGSMDRAIEEAARILQVNGKVYPVTLDKTNLVAVLSDKTRIVGEAKIDKREVKINLPIEKVYLRPKARVFKKAYDAILKADFIVIAPGSLYTSLVPILLVENVKDAIGDSKGDLAYVVNLMTNREETDNYKASDYVKVLQDYLGVAKSKLKFLIVNKKVSHSKSIAAKWYKKYGSYPVENDLKKAFGNKFKIVEKNFLSEATLFRHDSEKLALEITKLG
jgi:uncharacterized cofD-like protein